MAEAEAEMEKAKKSIEHYKSGLKSIWQVSIEVKIHLEEALKAIG